VRSSTEAGGSNVVARCGFVLLEAVVALAIIALVAVALMGATSLQVRTADKSALLLVASALADERMATLRGLGWDELVRLPDSLAAGVFPPPFEAYEWRAEVAPAEGEHDLFTAGLVVLVADEAFYLRTLLHEPRPAGVVASGPTRFEQNHMTAPR
jgi:hypothetical protein